MASIGKIFIRTPVYLIRCCQIGTTTRVNILRATEFTGNPKGRRSFKRPAVGMNRQPRFKKETYAGGADQRRFSPDNAPGITDRRLLRVFYATDAARREHWQIES